MRRAKANAFSINQTIENVAAFFGGQQQTIVNTQQTDVKEVLNANNAITRGRFYQLGQTVDDPQGLGNIDAANFELYYASANASIVIGSGDLSSVSGLTLLPANATTRTHGPPRVRSTPG